MFRYIFNMRNSSIFIVGFMIFIAYYAFASDVLPSNDSYQNYNGNKITFNYPKKWSILDIIDGSNGHITIKFGSTGISIVTIEIEGGRQLDPEKRLTKMQLIKSYKDYYNKGSNAFAKLETEKSPVIYAEIERNGKSGLKESRSAKFFGENVAFIKEFFLIDLPGRKNVFVTLDADKEEYPNMVAGFESILASLKDFKPSSK